MRNQSNNNLVDVLLGIVNTNKGDAPRVLASKVQETLGGVTESYVLSWQVSHEDLTVYGDRLGVPTNVLDSIEALAQASLEESYDLLDKRAKKIPEGLEPTLMVTFSNGVSTETYQRLLDLASSNIMVWKQGLYVGAVRTPAARTQLSEGA